MKRVARTKDFPGLMVRLVVGLIFLSEGIQKFLYPDTLGAGRFAKLGIGHPVLWANVTGSFEVLCSLMVLAGLLTRLAVIPLLVIMAVAFVTTKWPLLLDKGGWAMLHEGRTDFAMTILLIFLFIYGSGKPSFDYGKYGSRKN